jgi:hypothetical protein
MKIFLLLISLTLVSTNSIAFFWDPKVKILCYGTKSLDLTFTYEFKDKEIFETVVMPKNKTITGKDELISLTKLEDCTIKDAKNWSCGGKTSYTSLTPYRSDLHSVLDGRYRFIPALSGGVPKDWNCERRVQSN